VTCDVLLLDEDELVLDVTIQALEDAVTAERAEAPE